MLHTTFRKLKEAGACKPSYKKMAKALGGVRKYGLDTPIPLDKVLEVCGLDDAFWSLRIILEDADKEIRLLVCDYAERVLPIFEREFPKDNRPRNTIAVTRLFIEGQATRDELEIARDAVWAAEDKAAARIDEAAWGAARIAAAAVRAAEAVDDGAAARIAAAAVRATIKAAEREWQTQRFLQLLEINR